MTFKILRTLFWVASTTAWCFLSYLAFNGIVPDPIFLCFVFACLALYGVGCALSPWADDA